MKLSALAKGQNSTRIVGRFGSRLQFPEDASIDFGRRLEEKSGLQAGNRLIRRKALPARLHFSRI